MCENNIGDEGKRAIGEDLLTYYDPPAVKVFRHIQDIFYNDVH